MGIFDYLWIKNVRPYGEKLIIYGYKMNIIVGTDMEYVPAFCYNKTDEKNFTSIYIDPFIYFMEIYKGACIGVGKLFSPGR